MFCETLTKSACYFSDDLTNKEKQIETYERQKSRGPTEGCKIALLHIVEGNKKSWLQIWNQGMVLSCKNTPIH